jgi:hypothetical protein
VLKWFVESKTRYLTWILVWKLADIGSTFLISQAYGWRAEAPFTAIGHLGPQFGHATVSLLTIPVALVLCYAAYIRTPVGAEIAMLFFPLITAGNLILLVNPIAGSTWNIATIVLVPVFYTFRGLEPIWFERSPSRDELLEWKRQVKAWKTKAFGGEQDAV